MKRAPELQPLSRDHHDALVVARHLRRAGAGDESVTAAIARLRTAWETQIRRHLQEEEELLLPAFAADVGAEHPLILRALTEHVALRLAVRRIASTDGGDLLPLLDDLGRRLDDHIRFEERLLFPAIEAALSPASLADLGREIQAAHQARPPACAVNPQP